MASKDYAFPQTRLGKSGPMGQLPPLPKARTTGQRDARVGLFMSDTTLVFGITLGERAMTDGLSALYQELLSGSYDCVDRIVLNAYFGMGHSPGGFRVWWRALTGSDETLDNAHLMRLAGRFSRRVRGYARAHDIPVVDCIAGERKHDVAGEHLAKTAVTEGLFLVLVGRRPGTGMARRGELSP